MTKKKGRQDEKRLPEISGAPELNEASPDADEEAEEFGKIEEYPIYLADDDRALVRMVTGSRGQLLDFAVVQQVHDDDGWSDVVRYDCAHGDVHVHSYRKGRNEPTGKRKICGLDEIEDGYKRAEAAIVDRWEENRRRYFNG
jgi:hypothetical protein